MIILLTSLLDVILVISSKSIFSNSYCRFKL